MQSEILLKQCEESHTKRSGPGGQHRNKTETAVVLTHRPTGIAAEASERRSQAANRRVAIWRLRLRLATEYRTQVARKVPSKEWRSRVRHQRITVRVDHDDYPRLIAEALDFLQLKQGDLSVSALHFGVSASQLVKLFKKQTAAWVAFTNMRSHYGLPVRK
ncbi:MAG: peptide chain release factor-like protein [Pirellulales bacterium]